VNEALGGAIGLDLGAGNGSSHRQATPECFR
jgi:hypothetical protein